MYNIEADSKDMINRELSNLTFILTSSLPILTTLITVPFFAHKFTQAELGILYILNFQSLLMFTFSYMGINTFLMRSAAPQKNKSQEIYLLKLLFKTYFSVISIFALVGILFKNTILYYYGISDAYIDVYYSTLLLSALEGFAAFYVPYFRIKGQYKKLLILEVIRTFTYLLLLASFIFYLELGLFGRNLAHILSIIPLLSLPAIWFFKYKDIKTPLNMNSNLRSFAIYWLPSSIFIVLFPFLDRLILATVLDLKAVASFSLAFSIVAMSKIIIDIIKRYLELYIFTLIQSNQSFEITLFKLSNQFKNFLSSMTVFIGLTSIIVYNYILPQQYKPDLDLCLLLLVGNFIFNYHSLMASRLLADYKTNIILIINSAGWLFKYLLFFIFLDSLGILSLVYALYAEAIIHFLVYGYTLRTVIKTNFVIELARPLTVALAIFAILIVSNEYSSYHPIQRFSSVLAYIFIGIVSIFFMIKSFIKILRVQ